MNLDWKGPYRTRQVVTGNFKEANSPGCYVWYVPRGRTLQPFYVGMTKRKLHLRLTEHCFKQLSGEYRCLDVKALRAGKCWREAERYTWKNRESFADFLRDWTGLGLGQKAYETLMSIRWWARRGTRARGASTATTTARRR